ncbi:PadR family transcriptional regulator [Naumannella huperziae]
MPRSSGARLFVLGCLRRGPRHGYAIRQEAVQDQVDSWSDLKPGSVYHALTALERENLVKVEAVGRDGQRPPRTTYALAPAGYTELHTLIADSIRTVNSPVDSVAVALRLADELDPDELIALLTARAKALHDRCNAHTSALTRVEQHLSPMERVAFDHTIARLKFEAEWFTRVAGELRHTTSNCTIERPP